jgi:hypothetical protein
MAQAERLNQAKAFLTKAQEYLASAEDNLVAERFTAAAGDAIHAGISAKAGVEYGTALLSVTKAEPLVPRAWRLVELAIQIVRLGG